MSGIKEWWSIEKTFEFIDLYRAEPLLWNPSHSLYNNRRMIDKAWERLADSMKISVQELKKKKDTLTGSFRRNKNKMLEKIKDDENWSGIKDEDIYKPVWMFYDALDAFLGQVYQPKVVPKDENNTFSLEDEQEATVNFNSDCDEQSEQEIELPSNTEFKRATNAKEVEIPLKRRQINDSDDEIPVKRSLMHVYSLEDDCDLYGRLLAKKLRKYSERERQKIMYHIDGLLLKRLQNTSPQPNSSQIVINGRTSSIASGSSYSNSPSP